MCGCGYYDSEQVFFFFCSDGHWTLPGFSPSWILWNTGRKCVYALTASRYCVGLVFPDQLALRAGLHYTCFLCFFSPFPTTLYFVTLAVDPGESPSFEVPLLLSRRECNPPECQQNTYEDPTPIKQGEFWVTEITRQTEK